MEQITREEMIGLLNVAACPASCVKGVIVRDELHGEIEQCQFCHEREKAIAALQAAEPAAYGLKNSMSGEWDGRTTVPLQDLDEYFSSALLPLFTLPCPPAKAQADLVWCGCGDGYPDDSYGAAYIDIFGHCENCHMGSETADPAAQVESWAGGFRINPMGNIERLRDGMFLYSCPNLPYEAQGWKLVPIEPTPDMTLQGALAGVEHGNGEFSQIGAEAVHKAMLTASPAPEHIQQEEAER